MAGALSVRGLRKQFSEEFKAQRKARRKEGKPGGKQPEPSDFPVAERVDAAGLKKLVEKWVAAGDGEVSVIKVTAVDATAQGIAASLKKQDFKDVLAEACTTEGPLWILIDRPARAADTEKIDAAANVVKAKAA